MNTRSLIATLAFATLAAPAFAGSDGFVLGPEEGGWSLAQKIYFDAEEGPHRAATPRAAPTVAAAPVESGFQFVGGDTGWQLSPHVLVLRDGKLVHSDECDHALRMASHASPADLDRAARVYGGA